MSTDFMQNASGNILVGVATGGAGCWAKGAGTAGKVIGYTAKAMDIGGNVVGAGKNVYDIYDNGPSLSNVAGLAGNGLGLAGNIKQACFTAGTQIVVGMEYDVDGNFVCYVTANIEDIQVGDLVYSYDTATGEVSLKAVTDTFVRNSDHINLLTIVDKHGREQTIETTDGHPFWVVTDSPDLERAARSVVDGLYHENIEPGLNGFWVEAKDLRVGDVFLGANGELSMLVATERVTGGITVYNFTVDDNHNYFVIARDDENGQTCILVHNALRYDGPKPQYHVNPAHVPSTGQGFNINKTPLPVDAQAVYRNAVPSNATNPRQWYGRAPDGKFYRFSDSNDGTAHFSGIFEFNDLPQYVKLRFGG